MQPSPSICLDLFLIFTRNSKVESRTNCILNGSIFSLITTIQNANPHFVQCFICFIQMIWLQCLTVRKKWWCNIFIWPLTENKLATQPILNMTPSSQSFFGQFLMFSVIFMTFLIFAEIKSFVKLKLILPNHPENQNSGKDHHSVMLLLSNTWQKWHLPSLPTVLHKTHYFLGENSLKICFSVSWSTL